MKINGRSDSININSFESPAQQVRIANSSSYMNLLSGAIVNLFSQNSSLIISAISGGLTSSLTAAFDTRYVFTSSFNPFSSSINEFTSSINTFSASVNSFTASQISLNSGLNQFSASINTLTQSLNIFSASQNIFSASVNSFTASQLTINSNLISFSASMKTFSASINAFTASINSLTASLSSTFMRLSSSTAQNVSGNVNFYGSINIGFTGSSNNSASIVPLSIMSQFGTGGGGSLYITGQSNTERIQIESYSNSGISGGFAQAQIQGIAANGTINSPAATTNGNVLMGFGGGGYDNTPSRQNVKALFAIKADDNWTTTSQPTRYEWMGTPSGSTTRVEFMRLDSSGNLGLGTSNPYTAITISSSARTTPNSASVSVWGSQGSEFYEAISFDPASLTAGSPGVRGVSTTSGDIFSPGQTLANTRMLFLGGGGYDNAGSRSGNTAAIILYSSESFTTTNKGSYITFETTPGGTTARNVSAKLDGNGNFSASGDGVFNGGYKQNIIQFSLTSSILSGSKNLTSNLYGIRVPWSGSIAGLSAVASAVQPNTGGSLFFRAQIAGVDQTGTVLTASNAGANTNPFSSFTRGQFTFNPGDIISISINTSNFAQVAGASNFVGYIFSLWVYM